MVKVLFFTLLFSVLSASVDAQLDHGRITYAVRFDGSGLSEEDVAMLPSEALISFNTDRMRMDMSMGSGMESAVIVNKNDVHVLMNVLGNRFAMRTSKDEIRKDSKTGDSYRVKQLTGEYKDIAGYRCRKAVLSAKEQEDMTVWFTDRLTTTATWYYRMEGLDGFPMEFDLNTTGMSVRMTASSVSEDAPPEEQFTIGAGYKLINQDALNTMMGSGR